MSNRAVGERIKATRLALDYKNAAEFGRLVDIAPNALNNYETGRSRPTVEQAVKIARVTGVTLDWIYLGNRANLPHRIVVRLPAEPTSRTPVAAS